MCTACSYTSQVTSLFNTMISVSFGGMLTRDRAPLPKLRVAGELHTSYHRETAQNDPPVYYSDLGCTARRCWKVIFHCSKTTGLASALSPQQPDSSIG